MFSESSAVAAILRTIFSLLVAVDLLGNTLVCLVVFRNQRMKTSMNYLLVNLAVSDMMVALFMVPQYLVLDTFTHPVGATGDFLCKFITGGNFMWTGAVCSVFSLVLIAFERYFAIIYPHRVSKRINKRKLKVVVVAAWTSAVLWNMPLFIRDEYVVEKAFCIDNWPPGWYFPAYSWGWLILWGIIPTCTMGFFYIRVIIALWCQSSIPVNASQLSIIKTRRRVTKMAITVTLVYFFCWMPTLIIYILDYYQVVTIGGVIHTITVLLMIVNSSVNPIVYGFQSSQFRRRIKEMITSCDQRLKANQLELRLDSETVSMRRLRGSRVQPNMPQQQQQQQL